MRAGIIISLIVVGGMVVVAPIIAEYRLKSEYQANVVRLLERPGTNSVNLVRDDISSPLQLGCWSTGTLMVLAGIILTVREQRTAMPPRTEQQRSSLATDDRPRRTEAGSGGFGIQLRSGQ
jgi:hypothetical protein